jgi:hypothetical protein
MQFRNATTDDIPQCIELLRNDGGFQAEPALWDVLPRLWTQQIEQQSIAGFQVFEKKRRHAPPQICGFRMSGFIQPAFCFSYAAHPYPQVTADIWRRVRDKQSPLLTRDEIAWANAKGELRLAVMHTCVEHRDPTHPDTQRILALLPQAWQQAHFGYHLKDLPVFEVFGSIAATLTKGAGYQQYIFAAHDSEDTSGNPGKSYVFCWNQAKEVAGATSLTAHALTHCPPPRFHFTQAQQRLLLAALDGRSDKEIAAKFGIRYDTVRQSWDSIFQRVESLDEAILPNPARRCLIEYVRQHLEEVRPFDKRVSDETNHQTPMHDMLSKLVD